jgi:thioester reductase-like protein
MEGRERLTAALQRIGASLDVIRTTRVEVVTGDVRHPWLGLEEGVWPRLQGELDTIYHAAARVNLVRPYEDLRADNVVGTLHMARLAAAGACKTLHYVSTLSVFVATDRDRGVLREDDQLERTRLVHGGYGQSKWAAEWLLRRAGERAGDVAVYRPGLVTGDSGTAACPSNDFIALFVRGVVRLGCLPELDAAELFFDVTPVEYAAAALVHLSLHAPSGNTYHIAGAGRASLRMLLDALRERGIRLETVSTPRWRERLGELERAAPEAAAACLALCRGLPAEFAHYRTMDLFQATGVEFDMTNTLAGLAGSGIACPPPTPELIGRYVDYILSPSTPP